MAGIDRVSTASECQDGFELRPKQVHCKTLMKKITRFFVTVSLGEASDIPKAKGVLDRENMNLLYWKMAGNRGSDKKPQLG